MEHRQISDLPSHVKSEIAKVLDAGKLWRSVINAMNPPVYNQAQIEMFGMATLHPGGSPTQQLLSSLEQKNRNTAELCNWIASVGHSNGGTQRLLSLLRGEEVSQGDGPTILRQPVARRGPLNSNMVLSCHASGRGNLSYQWFKSRVLLQGQTQSELHFYNLRAQDQGHYTCRVSDLQRQYVFTNWAEVKVDMADQVNALPDMNRLLITVEPQQNVHVPHGEILKLYCDAVGVPPPKFQWFKGDDPIPDASDREWLKHNVCQDDSGTYHCQIYNDVGESIMSNTVSVLVMKGKLPVCSTRGPPVVPLKITDEPNTPLRTLYGGILSLFCDAVGNPSPKFQWLKEDLPIAGATDREYLKQSVTEDDSGVYRCQVYNDAEESITSAVSQVYVEKVSGKMALLIGNKDYYCADRVGHLFHPINDVCELSASLTALDFKVVSLVNLTLEEMKVALHQFCSLLDEDMCALFYFAGHGFESVSGESYLMPISATESYSPTENMPVADVLSALQEMNAQLNVILLDCCRTTPAYTVIRTEQQPPQSRVQQKNVVIASGCCPQGCVYESQNEKNGFFVLHLIRHISKTDLDVEMLLRRVSEGVKNENLIDRKTGMQQIVSRHSTLSVNYMSLATPVSPTAGNPYIAAKMARWKSAHEIPEEDVTVFEGDGVLVKLRFLAELSNKMIVNAKVCADECRDASVEFNMPKTVGGCGVDYKREKAQEAHTIPSRVDASVHITDLQRLLGNLSLRLIVTYTVNGQEKQVQVEYVMPEKPLYAKLVSS